MSVKDLNGHKYGKISVIRQITKEEKKKEGLKSKNAFWFITCSCNLAPYIRSSDMIVRGLYSCDKCARREVNSRKRKNYIKRLKAKKYGLLKVIRDWGSNANHQARVLCQCDCGGQIITYGYRLEVGYTKSCGCLDWGEDSYPYFLEHPIYADSKCYFYIAEINKELLKLGITNNLDIRKKNNQYKSYKFNSLPISRCEAWTIEQIILHETKKHN